MFITYLFVLILIIVAVVVTYYNELVKLRHRANESWSDIDVSLKRRYDLIPNLVETVKAYAAHEQQTLERVIQARNMAMNASSTADKMKTENELSQTLKSIFALSENYPELKANENFKQLQSELVDTENKIQASRRFYNTNVRDLNIKIDTFPTNLIANMFSFKKMSLFEIENKEERENVKVKF